jgi:hypothetical protein
MKYPNLRYGNPNALQFYAANSSVKVIAKQLRRSERSVKNWMSGRKKMPWWVPEVLRLQQFEHREMLRQMNIEPQREKLGLVSKTAQIIPIPNQSETDGQIISAHSVGFNLMLKSLAQP